MNDGAADGIIIVSFGETLLSGCDVIGFCMQK
jgi:hypothetical protein